MTQQGKTRTRRKTAKDVRQETVVEQANLLADQEYNCLLLTNRYNLLDILSSELIKPASLYKKYYADSGAVCPEGIPLFVNAPPASFVERVTGIEIGLFPVLLEIDMQGMHGSVQLIRTDYRREQAELPFLKDSMAFVVSGVIPVSRVRRVYFQSTLTMEEHIAREYENIRGRVVPLQVSPDHFAGAEVNAELLLEAFAHSNDELTPLSPAVLSAADSLSGAMLMLGGLATSHAGIPLATVKSIIEELQHPGNGIDTLAGIQYAVESEKWLDLLPSLLLRDEPDIFRAVVDNPFTGNDVVELMLFVSAVNTLSRTQPEEYFHSNTLSDIREAFEMQMGSIPLKQNHLLYRYQEILGSIQAVLRNRIDLEEFPFAESGVATALLLFLLRSDPIRALSWIEEKLRISPDTFALIAAFSGILYGHSRIPVVCRPDTAYEKYVDDMVARRLNIRSHGLMESGVPGIAIIESAENHQIRQETLKIVDQVLIRRELREDRKEVTIPAYKRSNKNILERLLESDLKNGPEREAAIYLCQVENWDECITTSIQLGGRRFILDASDPRKPELRFPGFLSQPPEIIVRADKFRRRLTSETWNRLSEKLRQDIEEIFRESRHTETTGKAT